MKRLLKIVFFFLLFTAPAAFAQTVPAEPEDISPLLIGEKVPNGEVYSAKGKEIKLHKVLDKKRTVLVFYRGGWCPFCNVQLAELQDAMAELEELGYQIVSLLQRMNLEPGNNRAHNGNNVKEISFVMNKYIDMEINNHKEIQDYFNLNTKQLSLIIDKVEEC